MGLPPRRGERELKAGSLEQSRKCLPSRQSFKSPGFDMATGARLCPAQPPPPQKKKMTLVLVAGIESNNSQKIVFWGRCYNATD